MLRDPRPHITRFAAACGLIATLLLVGAAGALAAIGSYTTRGAWSFVSAPRLHPPILRTLGPPGNRGVAGSEVLVTNSPGNPHLKMVGAGGPLILDSHLQPIWAPAVGTNVVAANLKLQTYNGKPALSWWEGVVDPHGITTSGEYFVVNQQYRTVATLKGAAGWVLSEHDMVISGHDAWVTAYRNVANAPGAPANVTVFDAAVQEYDLTTGKLLYTWDALQHIPLSDSRQAPPASGVWDAYHENSIQLVSGNRFLVSMRQEWAAYLVSATTSGVEWTLGGKHSTFRFGRGAEFEWQHDVALHGKQVSLFDDHCCGFTSAGKVILPSGPSRALVLTLDTTSHTATVARSIVRNRGFDSTFLGNAQLLRNGNVVVSWGSTPYFSEYGKRGKLLADVSWPGNARHITNESYRAYVVSWHATPYYPPSGAVRASNGKATVYASWNGATGVAAWRVLGGSSAGHLSVVGGAKRTGFETAINLAHTYGTYEVEALDSHGRVIGTSKPFSGQHSSGGGNPGNQFYP